MANIVEILFKQTGAEKVAGSTGKVTRSTKDLTAAALKYTGAAVAVIAIGKKLIDAYGVQELAEKNLESALGHTNQKLLDQASALQKVSKHGDEEIIALQALASNMGIAEDQIGDATEMAIGLSEALNLDLNMAMKAAAGAIQGDTNMLTRYIPLLKTTTDQSEKLAIVQKTAAKGLKQSADSTETVAGQMTQASMAIGDAGEAIGESFAEPVRLAAAGVTFLAEGMSKFLASIKGLGLHTATAEQRLNTLDKLVNEHADISIPNLVRIYTMLGMGYDENISRGQNFARVLVEQEQAQTAVNEAASAAASAAAAAATAAASAAASAAAEELKQFTKDIKGKSIPALEAMSDEILENITVGGLWTEETQLAQDKLKALNDEYAKHIELLDTAAMSTRDLSKQSLILHGEFEAQEGIVNDLRTDWQKAGDGVQIYGDATAAALSATASILAETAGDNKSQVIMGLRLSQAAAIASTAAGIMKAFEQGGVLGFLTGTAIGITGATQVSAIQGAISNARSAATGLDEVFDKPTLIEVGDQRQGERVQITPEGGEAAGAMGITVNIYSPITYPGFTRDVILPEIREALRLGI